MSNEVPLTNMARVDSLLNQLHWPKFLLPRYQKFVYTYLKNGDLTVTGQLYGFTRNDMLYIFWRVEQQLVQAALWQGVVPKQHLTPLPTTLLDKRFFELLPLLRQVRQAPLPGKLQRLWDALKEGKTFIELRTTQRINYVDLESQLYGPDGLLAALKQPEVVPTSALNDEVITELRFVVEERRLDVDKRVEGLVELVELTEQVMPLHEALTPRQLAVVDMFKRGDSYAEVAQKLNVQPRTLSDMLWSRDKHGRSIYVSVLNKLA